MSEKVVVFGAGRYGRMALEHYKNQVAYFVDNNENLWGTKIKGVEVKSLDFYKKEQERYPIVIASKQYTAIEAQLVEEGVLDYSVYLHGMKSFYETDEVVYNVYEDNSQRNLSENDYNNNLKDSKIRTFVNAEVERLHKTNSTIEQVEIETVNRCNGSCLFCPVNKKADTREYKEMSQELFENIIGQLSDMDYSGRLALFSNNEPFLDKQIVSRHKYARKMLPNAYIWLYTNGTLLHLDQFIEIVDYVNEFVLDNYQADLKLIKPAQEIVQYCEKHEELKKKVTVALRNPNEILSTRGGDAPNRKEKVSYGDDRCMLPYKQFIIRPDGKISLCCNDPLGKNTLGDLTQNTILEVWNNDRFKMVRQCLYEGRKNWKHCEFCDHFGII